MKRIYTYISSIFINNDFIKDKTVIVVDVLKATSTIYYALYSGIEEIIPIKSVTNIKLSDYKNYIKTGEQSAKLLNGFEYMNSPSFFKNHKFNTKKMLFCSTNGTKAILKAKMADTVLLGGFLNIQALANFVLNETSNDVVVLCSGWKDNLSYEDLLFTGQFISLIKQKFSATNDTSLFALDLFLNLKIKPVYQIKNLALSNKLSGENSEQDINASLIENFGTILPVFKDGVIRKLD